MSARTYAGTVVWVLAWLVSLLALFWPMVTHAADVATVMKTAVERIVYLTLWIMAWSWVTTVQQGQTQLNEHTRIAAATALGEAVLLGYVLPWILFGLGWPWPAGLYTLGQTMLMALATLFHLRQVCRPWHTRHLVGWAAVTSLAMALTVAYVWAETHNEQALKQLPYTPNIYPAYGLPLPAHGLEGGLEELWNKGWSGTP